MANRAYLFATDIADFNQIENDEEPFYDSRWNIPLLWFLFFAPESIKQKTINFRNSAAEREVILFEDKEIALDRFEKLYPFLEEFFSEQLFDRTQFIKNIEDWDGKNLVLNPRQVINGDDLKTFQNFSEALAFIQIGETEKFVKILDGYAGGFERIDKDLNRYFIGYTYR